MTFHRGPDNGLRIEACACAVRHSVDRKSESHKQLCISHTDNFVLQSRPTSIDRSGKVRSKMACCRVSRSVELAARSDGQRRAEVQTSKSVASQTLRGHLFVVPGVRNFKVLAMNVQPRNRCSRWLLEPSRSTVEKSRNRTVNRFQAVGVLCKYKISVN